MAVHKVPQDVEADDKFLGPLSFKQFLFAAGVVVFGYLSFLTLTKAFIISPIFILPTLGFAALAFPWSKEQPTELWLAARIRFFLKPRKRIWDQSGVKELVQITAPVRPPHIYSDGLSQTEVKSRLSALATMVDSRGWASKNSTRDTSQLPVSDDPSDRLVAPIKQAVDQKTATLEATVDVLDPSSGTVGQNLDQMIAKSEQERKQHQQEVVEQARQNTAQNPQQSQDFWFMNQSQQPTSIVNPGQNQPQVQQATPMSAPHVNTNVTKEQENALLEKAHERQKLEEAQKHAHHEKVIAPAGQLKPSPQPDPAQQQQAQQQQPAAQSAVQQPVQATPAPQPQPVQEPVQNQQQTPVPPQTNPDIMRLSNNDDLSVQAIAHEANKNDNSDDEGVVISLR